MNTKSWRTRPAAFFLGDPAPLARHGAVAVIGLGRFGGSLAAELAAYGVDVIGIDIDEAVVAGYSETLAFVSRADATDEAVLRQLGIDEVSRVVIAIGSDLEASILTASKILKIGNRHIWAKAISQTHADILDQLGIENVIRPENDMGRRLAHLIRGHMSDFLPISEDFVLARTTVPTRFSDSPLGSFDLRRHHGVTVVAFRRGDDEHWDIADQDVTLYGEDEMLIAGTPRNVEDFSAIDKDD
ncbi:potassium channel family protein [Brevibacterium marinum]|uniref:Trk system potassium uptake protein TrkA n=1 Tax=Brevibacterium marinum TaxID=418643 RepID=A0A846RWF9_9MICO|nr:TrkA family potassium uptake protein [Brevibacterium marinum]NJC56296.1 trk system potassium uptake protein TrkA [Brevibacterium marinum]